MQEIINNIISSIIEARENAHQCFARDMQRLNSQPLTDCNDYEGKIQELLALNFPPPEMREMITVLESALTIADRRDEANYIRSHHDYMFVGGKWRVVPMVPLSTY